MKMWTVSCHLVCFFQSVKVWNLSKLISQWRFSMVVLDLLKKPALTCNQIQMTWTPDYRYLSATWQCSTPFCLCDSLNRYGPTLPTVVLMHHTHQTLPWVTSISLDHEEVKKKKNCNMCCVCSWHSTKRFLFRNPCTLEALEGLHRT